MGTPRVISRGTTPEPLELKSNLNYINPSFLSTFLNTYKQPPP